MNNMTNLPSLSTAVATWKVAAQYAVHARANYLRRYAEALAKSEAKNAEGRKADADVGALDERTVFELAQIDEKAARWMVESLLGGRASVDAEAA